MNVTHLGWMALIAMFVAGPVRAQTPGAAAANSPSPLELVQQTGARVAQQASATWLELADRLVLDMQDDTKTVDATELSAAYELAIENAGAGAVQAGAGRARALATVQQATQRHHQTLATVLDRVPDVAKPHIQRAMQVSRSGHDRALQAMAQAGRGQAGRPAGVGGPPGGRGGR